ncbi:flavodoxin family protein [Pontibacter toksunensis]|uniref:Flavodoxin family protein n=1 Tax=Pontibacter toksunensis TaxID=1332631 RepID=A0ABW6BPE2_9BACT
MDNKPAVIIGSARRDSDTKKLVEVLFPESDVKVLDLLDYKLDAYNYSGAYSTEDQFLQIVEELLPHQQLIFATPVYWYSMSGLLKTFFDRLTDLVTVQKTIGRKLAGKETFMVAVGAENELPLGFEKPFELTSDYFDMTYRKGYYCQTKEIHIPTEGRALFLKEIKRTQKILKT